MVRNHIAPFIVSLLIVLVAGLAPAAAFADEVTAGTSNLTTQSSSYRITSPTASDVCIVGQPITVEGYANFYLYYQGYAVTNRITFKVSQDGKTVYYGSAGYNSAGSYVSVEFTPKKAGKYKIEMSSTGFSEKSEDSFEAADSITIKVKKASAFKNMEANLSANRVAQNKVELSWDIVGSGAKIYRATKRDGEYKLIKTINASKGNTFVDKVNKKENYFYKLRYFLKDGKKEYLSKFSTSQWKFAKAPSKPTNVKAVKKGKKVKLTWKTAKDCGHFIIYRSTKKKGGYEVLGYVAGDEFSFFDKSVESGKKYFYKVDACIYYDWSGVTKTKKSGVVSIKA